MNNFFQDRAEWCLVRNLCPNCDCDYHAITLIDRVCPKCHIDYTADVSEVLAKRKGHRPGYLEFIESLGAEIKSLKQARIRDARREKQLLEKIEQLKAEIEKERERCPDCPHPG